MAGDISAAGAAPLLALANGYYRAIEAAQGNLPESTQLVLRRSVGGWRLSWPLALILAGGRIVDQGGQLPAGFIAAGGDQLVAQLAKVKSAFPTTFLRFLSSVETGEEAAAASYFQSTLAGLAGYVRELLNGFLVSAPFLSVAQSLVASFGGPRLPRTAAPAAAAYQVDPGSPSPLDQSALVAARLRAANWEPADVERILAGPDRAHLTAERLYRQVATNSAADQAAFLRSVKGGAALDPSPVSVDPTLLQRSTQRLSGAGQLKQAFDNLSPQEQARLLALLRQQPLENPDVQFAKPGKAPAGGKKAPADDGVTGVLKSGLDLANSAVKGLLGGTSDRGGGGKAAAAGPKGKAGGAAKGQKDSSDEEDTDQADQPAKADKSDKGNSATKSDSAGKADKSDTSDAIENELEADIDSDANDEALDAPEAGAGTTDGEPPPMVVDNSEDVVD